MALGETLKRQIVPAGLAPEWDEGAFRTTENYPYSLTVLAHALSFGREIEASYPVPTCGDVIRAGVSDFLTLDSLTSAMNGQMNELLHKHHMEAIRSFVGKKSGTLSPQQRDGLLDAAGLN